ncbi:hypothetical protein BJ875DRAFT_389286, partial [Amylocarpus encephaloides]
YHRTYQQYGSRIRILTARGNSGMWALGSKLLLKDFPNDGFSPGNNYITQNFLRNQPSSTIPLVKEMQLLTKPTDKTYLPLMSRAEGKTLAEVWDTLSEVKKENIRDQLVDYLKQLRKFTAPGAQTVKGGKIDDLILGNCDTHRPRCKKSGLQMTNEISDKISPVVKAWHYCRIEHPQYWNCWLRPPFSKCHNWARRFSMRYLVPERVHEIANP